VLHSFLDSTYIMECLDWGNLLRFLEILKDYLVEGIHIPKGMWIPFYRGGNPHSLDLGNVFFLLKDNNAHVSYVL